MSKIYGEIKEKLMEIRKEVTDKGIKCYVLTKDLNVYAITKVSKRKAYYQVEGQEVMLNESIVDIYENSAELLESISKMKVYYEGKLSRLFGMLHKVDELENKYKGETNGIR